jgi:hypothetical protein
VYDDYECGDSEPWDEYKVTDYESAGGAEAEIASRFEHVRKRQYRRYLEWVIEHSEDPMGEFGASPVRKRDRRYQCVIAEGPEGQIVWQAWRRTRGAWREPFWAPYPLHDYLGVMPDKPFLGERYGWNDPDCDNHGVVRWQNVDDLQPKRWLTFRPDGPSYYGPDTLAFEVQITEETPNRGYPMQLRLAARERLRLIDADQ